MRKTWKKLAGIVLSVVMMAGTGLTATAAGSSFGWPLQNDTRYYLYRGVGNGHEGLDIAANDEQPVVAAADGVVKGIFTGCTNHDGYDETGTNCKARGKCSPTYRSGSCPQGYSSDGFCNGGNGNCVIIYHPAQKMATSYAHMVRIASGLKAGDTVKKGQVIGYAGSTGRSSGTHLHIETRVGAMGSSAMTFWNNRLVNLLDYLPSNIVSKVSGSGSNGHVGIQTVLMTGHGLGDVNDDGTVNVSDALSVLRFVAGSATPGSQEKIRANVNGDSTINAQDALDILRFVVRK